MSVFSDINLARRLERTEGRSNADFVETRAKLDPSCGATWIEVAGAYAMFDGTRSPLTQTFGLGLFADAEGGDLAAIERFYAERGAPVFHEVSPIADARLLELLPRRGYHPVELTSVMYQSIGRGVRPSAPAGGRVQVRRAKTSERQLWAATGTAGWCEMAAREPLVGELLEITAQRQDALLFLAEISGQPAAAGAMMIHDGVALLAGASTVPAHRRQGAQLALLHGRLEYAAAQGCDLAMIGASPGGSSQRNAERHGFRIAYTRIKWRLGGVGS